MTVSIKTYIERSVPGENQYRVKFTVIEAIGITPDVFVYDTEHNVFLNVASVYDMESYPADRATAQTAGLRVYRASAVERTYQTVRGATGFEIITRNRLKILVTEWNSISATYPGTEYYTAES